MRSSVWFIAAVLGGLALAAAFSLTACNDVLGIQDVVVTPADNLQPNGPRDASSSSCANDCDGTNVGGSRCSNTAGNLDVCIRGSDGCPSWRSTPCTAGACDAANPQACVGSCANECPQEGATQCDGATAKRTCTLTGACLKWSASSACPGGQSCFGDSCATSCTSDPECTSAGTKVCASSGTFRACAEAAPACLKLGTAQGCPSGETCSGAGVCSCTGCMQGGSCQAGNQPQACGKGGGSCQTCPSGQSCDNGTCKCTGCVVGGTCYAAGSDYCCGANKTNCTVVLAKCSGGNCVCQGTNTNCFDGAGQCINCTLCGKVCGTDGAGICRKPCAGQ